VGENSCPLTNPWVLITISRANVSTMVEQTAIQRFTERFFLAADAELDWDETEVDTAA
jgi:hypothetical protein